MRLARQGKWLRSCVAIRRSFGNRWQKESIQSCELVSPRRLRRRNLNLRQKLFLCFAVSLSMMGAAQSMCAAHVELELSVKVAECQSVEIGNSWRESVPLEPRKNNDSSQTLSELLRLTETHSRKYSVHGTLISGYASITQRYVGYPPPHFGYSPQRARFEEDRQYAFFLREPADQACEGFDKATEHVFLTFPLCCDQEPFRGLCLVPRSIVVLSREKPENWFKYEPSIRVGR